MNENVREVIIIGGGPAGYTAALYAARANLYPLVIEGFQWGGQLMITSDVENYPGYPEGVLGPEMMKDFRRQAERFGAEFVSDDVTRVDFSERPFRVYVGDDEYRAEAVIVATGAEARKLGLESERKLQARGVSVQDAAFREAAKGVGPHVSPNDREMLTLESGVTWERLGQVPHHHVDFLLVTYQPGSTSSSEGRLMRHSGTEYAYLISGELELSLGFDKYVMGKATDAYDVP